MKRKVLLMGQSGCGKTSMRSLIFSSYRAADTRRLGSTLDVEHSHVRFLGNLVLNLWDCGGQQSYMDSYLDKQRSQVFSTVGVLIYVFDLVGAEGGEEGQTEWERDLRYYKDCISALYQYSPDAQVFCLLHKMDLVDKDRRAKVYSDRVKELRRKSREVAQAAGGVKVAVDGFKVNSFATSIWDESLYRAWGRIVQTQIPALSVLERHLQQLADTCSASEVVVFERTTFLVIAKAAGSSASAFSSSSSNNASFSPSRSGFMYEEEEEGMEGFRDTQGRQLATHALGSGFISSSSFSSSTDPFSEPSSSSRPPTSTLDPERFEKVSELIKTFKLSCQKLPAKTSQCEFQAVELKAPNFSAYIDSLTSNTYIMILVTDPSIQMASVKLNVELARDHFERLQAINPRS
ncbi:related to GTR1 - GTP-binding protein [Melanopsichium pennsylvanicum]|uniref:GTP-binding protein n=2 Tax=Melanopsichium pennsylvanicum TaxID=63383 RepID=A0AAJ4XG74_9BASI|nr:related to GTR1-GTP-binding protein [Melanopsichium pennsylvanicum 4]SNX81543.1 related to GTR1 - GTP-binding protein [Melanopsichium pennsylvanicum]